MQTHFALTQIPSAMMLRDFAQTLTPFAVTLTNFAWTETCISFIENNGSKRKAPLKGNVCQNWQCHFWQGKSFIFALVLFNHPTNGSGLSHT